MTYKRVNRRRRGRSGAAGWVLLLLTAVAVGLALTSKVFVVKTINVVGTGSVPAGEVVAASGIKVGDSIFRVNNETVAHQFELVGRVGFEGVVTSLPSTVTLQVRERIPRVIVNYAGLPTILDEFGYALEQGRELNRQNLPLVTGLRAISCQVGRKIQSETVNQVDAMNAVVTALYATQVYPIIAELNVSDLDNMYLMLRSGLMVKIGDSTNMQNKLAWMVSVINQPEVAGAGGLNVSTGNSAVVEPGSAPPAVSPQTGQPGT